MKWLAIPAVLMATVVFAQKPTEPKAAPPADKKKRPTLEELLAAALQHSPEVQVAEAKLKEAEAQLRQTRLQLAQKLIEINTSIEAQSKNLNLAEEDFDRASNLWKGKALSKNEFAESERKLQLIKSQVAQLEASLATLTGQLPVLNRVNLGQAPGMDFRGQGMGGGGVGLGGALGGGGGAGLADEGPKPRWPRQAMADRMAKALDQPVAKVNKFDGIPLADLMEHVREQSKEVPILAKLDGLEGSNVTVNFKGELTLGSLFEVLTDTIPDLKIFVRDYGFLITFSHGAPDDGLLVGDFWRQRQMQAK